MHAVQLVRRLEPIYTNLVCITSTASCWDYMQRTSVSFIVLVLSVIARMYGISTICSLYHFSFFIVLAAVTVVLFLKI